MTARRRRRTTIAARLDQYVDIVVAIAPVVTGILLAPIRRGTQAFSRAKNRGRG